MMLVVVWFQGREKRVRFLSEALPEGVPWVRMLVLLPRPTAFPPPRSSPFPRAAGGKGEGSHGAGEGGSPRSVG